MANDRPVLHVSSADAATTRVGSAKARKAERLAAESPEAAHGVVRAVSDENLTASLYLSNFGRNSRLVVGRVIFTFPYAHWYRVQLDVGNGEIPCCKLMETSSEPFSVSSSEPLPPLTRVLVLLEDGGPFGVIIGCLPKFTTQFAPNFSDWISQGSGGGTRRERYYTQFPDLFEDMGGVFDFSNNRPVDTLAIGEWGRFNNLGGGLHIDPFMLFFRVDEMCGMWQYYMDRLLRLCAYNWDFRTAMSEESIRNDSGEGDAYMGSTPYPWEALGTLSPGLAARTVPDADVHYNSPLGKTEPAYDDQQAFFRYERFRGYLGQAEMRHVQLPPTDDTLLCRFSQERAGTGVFREQLGLDGSWSIMSAHSLHIGKRLLIPIPKRMKQPEDATGDEPKNYRAAGLYGDGDAHKLQDIPGTTEENAHVWTATALLDVLAHHHNWKGLHPFHYHAKDFFTPPGAGSRFSSLQAPLDYSDLTDQPYLSSPTPVEVKVDHRLQAHYYETESGTSYLPDGSVVHRDGYGSEIRMNGGNITIAAAGDVVFQAGRNVVTLAGDDAIIKARSSVDISASEHDVRLKAENHLELLAGNSGRGRLLLDCRSTAAEHDVSGKQGEAVGQSGLVIKAENSEAAIIARDLYLRTTTGQIAIDAAKGNNLIRMVASQVANYVQSSLSVIVSSGETPQVAHYFGRNSQIESSLSLKGGLVVTTSGILAKGNIVAIDGQTGVIRPDDLGYAQAQSTISGVQANFQSLRTSFQNDFLTLVKQKWQAAGQIGNDTTISNTQFAPRTDEQMRTTNFVIPEAYFQQLAAGGTGIWRERSIRYQGQEMMPYPGLKRWKTDKALLQVNLKLRNITTGRDAAPGTAYEAVADGAFTETVADDNYKVLKG